MLGESVACGTSLKYEQTNLLQAYKRSLLLTFQIIIHILEKKKKGYTHSISF
jgi:hypothetical protein